MKITCEFCGREIAKGGAYDAHVYFKHRREMIARFRANPVVQVALLQFGIAPKQLTNGSRE